MQFAGNDEAVGNIGESRGRRRRPARYYMAPQAYAQFQVLEQAITATKASTTRSSPHYIAPIPSRPWSGDVKFGAKGEWAESRVVQTQFQT